MPGDPTDDPAWPFLPLLAAGFPLDGLRSLVEWMRFEDIAAQAEGRPVSLVEIKRHMTAEQAAGLDEAVRRIRDQRPHEA